MGILLSLVFWLLFGFVVGLIARAMYPSRQWIGFLPTAGLGLLGSFAGGVLGTLIAGGNLFRPHAAGFLGSIVGAVVVLSLVHRSRRKAWA
jgi:uncharacterized membrane protein YeaQ/YmgE (transglycosylase-associated protein family)